MNEGPKSRIRLKFARLEPAKDFTHLEQIKALRSRAAASGLKFQPARVGGASVPRMAFGPAISVGHESLCEYADLFLEEFVREESAREKIQAFDDANFRLLAARRIPVFFPSIEAAVNAVEYFLEGTFPAGFSQASLDVFAALKNLPYEKVKPSGERKMLDARAPLLSASWDACARPPGTCAGLLKLTLRLSPGRNVKPEIVAELMAAGRPELRRITRKEFYWQDSQGKLGVF